MRQPLSRMLKLLELFLIAMALTTGTVNASGVSPLPPKTASEIQHMLGKLQVLGSVMYLAAHPDDENTHLIAHLAKEKGYRTVYLSLTRGDGGQNLIGSEKGADLGILRTQEMLAARRIDGAEQWFTRAYDFGYSKSAEETLRFWNREEVLADIVWAIRHIRPDVVITRFPSNGGGHGHHTASAILANEAYLRAADPKSFPEQLTRTDVWRPERLLWNRSRPPQLNDRHLRLNVGGYIPLLGKSTGEIAGESRSMHRCQAMGTT
ncbi:MAG: PIG-L family deacetylase, partial [Planctomycetaceae bacterium]|nr:PIG-L family deacetylase [Planctomycetaceae bacterium]